MDEKIFHLGIKAVILNTDKKMLLLSSLKGFDLPGGRVQKSESPLDTLSREVFEETGIEKLLNTKHLYTGITQFRIVTKQGEVGLIFSIYSCDTPERAITLSEEHTKSFWLDIEKAAELLRPTYPKDFIEKLIENSISIKANM